MKTHSNHSHPDLEALLKQVSLEEATRLREVWDLAGHDEPTDYPDALATEAAVQRLHRTMERRAADTDLVQHATDGMKRLVDRRPRAGRAARHRRTVWRRGAAVGLALLFVGALGLFWWQQPVTETAPLGERLALTLPDGSRVELNSGSSLRYARHFGDVRAVRLYGEAFFDVAAEARPFVVQTFNAQIRVLGTRFGVRAWSGSFERTTTVALEAGRVALAPVGQPERAFTMMPGEIRRVGEGKDDAAQPKGPDLSVDEATAWRRGDLVFKDQRLGVILNDVERRFAVDLQVQPVALMRRRLGLVLRQPASAEAVVHDLSVALGLRYQATSNGFVLYAEAP